MILSSSICYKIRDYCIFRVNDCDVFCTYYTYFTEKCLTLY